MVDREALINDLRQVAQEAGTPVSTTDYREHGEYAVSQVYDEFDSFPDARETAGVDDGEFSHPNKIPREELAADIRTVQSEVDGVVTYAEYENHGEYSMSAVEREFGDWTQARTAVGIEGSPEAHNRVSTDTLLAELRRLREEVGRVPRRHEMDAEGEFGYSVYERRFGGWNDALQEAGFEPSKSSDPEYVEIECDICGTTVTRLESQAQDSRFCSQECKNEYQRSDEHGGESHPLRDRVTVECAHCGEELQIKPSEVKDNNFCSYDCQGKYRSRHQVGENHPRFKGGGRLYYGPNWQQQKKKCRERDDYECRLCGKTDEESLEEFGKRLEVHHRKPVREFVRQSSIDMEDMRNRSVPQGTILAEIDYEKMNALENLVTLCLRCHRKVESMDITPQFIE